MKYSIIYETRHQLIILRAKIMLSPVIDHEELEKVDHLIQYYSDYIEAYDQKQEVK